MINYKEPFEVTEVFRIPVFKKEDGEHIDPEYDAVMAKIKNTTETKEQEYKEFAGKTWVCWEDIKSIREYAFTDDWKTYKGNKYVITFYGEPEGMVVYGDMYSIVEHWKEYKNKQ